jgi:hypothetical protein
VRCGDAYANTNCYLYANFDAYSDIYTYCYGNSYVHTYTYTYSHSYGYGYAHTYCYSNTYCDSIRCLPTNAGLLEKSFECLASE